MLDSLAQMSAAGLPVESILHVGANEGQERFDYRQAGASPCFYVEPVDAAFGRLERNVADMPGHHAIKAVCSDHAGEDIVFNVASNGGQSSSFLDLGLHAQLHPAISYTAAQPMTTTTIDRLIAAHSPGRVPNLWVIDAQGADLHVLRGGAESLPHVDGVFVEVAERPLYAGGSTRAEITRYLGRFGLSMRWHGLDAHGNGDAFYCRDRAEAADLPTYGGNVALGRPAEQSSLCEWSHYFTAQGPAGGVNGHVSGFFGFHTGEEDRPWWQVDLGTVRALNEVRIYNRVDGARDRARTLQVLLSDDGSAWHRVHDQAGYTFDGANRRPLRVLLAGRSARFVRLQLDERNYLHLDEVEIY